MWKAITASGLIFAKTPSSTIIRAPPRSPDGTPSSAGWKMNMTVPGSWSRMSASIDGGAEQRRRVHVVAAGVHDADVLVEVGAAHRGLEGIVRLLGDRQPVHVRAHRDRPGRACRRSGCRPRPCARCRSAPRCRATSGAPRRARPCASRDSRARGSGACPGAARCSRPHTCRRAPRSRRRSAVAAACGGAGGEEAGRGRDHRS